MNALKNEMSQLNKSLRNFHEDEDGMETIQVVMLVGIAAIILIVVKIFWGQIRDWVRGLWNQVRNPNGADQF